MSMVHGWAEVMADANEVLFDDVYELCEVIGKYVFFFLTFVSFPVIFPQINPRFYRMPIFNCSLNVHSTSQIEYEWQSNLLAL